MVIPCIIFIEMTNLELFEIGIDRHKRMVRFQFNEDDDTIDSGDEDASTSSPNVQATFTDCSITSIKLNDAKMSRAIARSGRRGKTVASVNHSLLTSKIHHALYVTVIDILWAEQD